MSAAKSDKTEKKVEPKMVAAPSVIHSEFRGKIYENILGVIGATPLIRLPHFSAHHKLDVDLVAKLEFMNPLGSVKDRVALSMFEEAEKAGKIKPGKSTIVEFTGGDMGVSLAFVAANKGYKIILVMPENVSFDRRKVLSFLGAEVVVTPADKGSKGALDKAKEILSKVEDGFMFNQFDNPANPNIHASMTAEEIWADTHGKVDIIISAVGTGGTITGLSQALKKKKPELKAYAVEPAESAVLSGGKPAQHKIEGIGAGFVPAILDTKSIDAVVKVLSAKAYETARQVAKMDGVPCGISAGAALAGALDVANLPENKGKVIVVILPSGAERYLTTALFDSPTR